MRSVVGYVIFAVILGSCGGDSGSSGSSDAIPDGTYDLTGPVCDETGDAPAYPIPNDTTPPVQALMRDFEDLTSRRVTLAGATMTEVAKDADCTLTVTQSIIKNESGELHVSKATTFVFEPADCTLAISVGGQPFPVDKTTGGGAIFADSTEEGVGGLLTVTSSDGTYSAVTTPVAGFGCGEVGKFRYSWKAATD